MARDRYLLVIFWLSLRLWTAQGATADEPLQEERRIPAGLEAVTVLAVDAAAGKAALRIAGGGLVVASKGEELPAAGDGKLTELLRFRIVDVLPDPAGYRSPARTPDPHLQAGKAWARLADRGPRARNVPAFRPRSLPLHREARRRDGRRSRRRSSRR